jgi:GAF domain
VASTNKPRTSWAIISTGVPIAGGFGAAQLLTIARAETNDALGWLYSIAAIVAFGGGLLVAIIAKVHESRRAVTLAEAREKQLIQLRDQLMPMASTIADMARHPLTEREPYLESVAKVAASALASVVGTHVSRPRAVVYLLDADVRPSMRSIAHSGRGDRPGPFLAGTVRGDAALDFLDGHRRAFYGDLSRDDKPVGYDGTMSDYATFVAVPIWTETGVYGMVTLDAPSAGSLDAGDVALTELVAEFMSAAFEVAQDQDSPPPGS